LQEDKIGASVIQANTSEPIDLMRGYLEVCDLSERFVRGVNMIPYSLKRPRAGPRPKITAVVKSLRVIAKSMGTASADFERKLTMHLKARKANRKPTRALEALAGKACLVWEKKLANIPPSTKKAEAYFRAELDFQPSPEFAAYFYDELKYLEHPALKKTFDWVNDGMRFRSMSAASPLSSLDPGPDTLQQFSRYCFFEKYAPDQQRDLLREIEASFREVLAHVVAEWDLLNRPRIIRPAVEHVGEHLWLVSRSDGLTRALLPQIRPVLDRLPQWQSEDGYWPTDTLLTGTSGHQLIPSVYATALCTLVLQKLSDDRHNDAVMKAIGWLWQQDQGGNWCRFIDGKETPDLQTTVIVLEALRRSGRSEEHHQIGRAENWILNQQTPVGFWGVQPWDRDFLSATILEYFRDLHLYTPPPLDEFLRLSRDFFRKAEELNEERGSASRRLAAVAGFHAIEFFIYGVITHPRFGMSHFKPNRADETIGLRIALDNLEERLKQDGKLEPNRHMRHRVTILRLASLRDGIVHRGHDIDVRQCYELLSAVRVFMSKYSRELLDRDITR
jgi:hypothetical protein